MKMNMRLQNIKAIIVDDESFNRMQLKLKLARLYPEISVVAECIDGMEGLRAIELYKPDLVFLPSSTDVHQDHQTIHNEGKRAFKFNMILGYEMPWNNLTISTSSFVILEERHILKKIAALSCYKTQLFRHYANEEFVRSLARTRGAQIAQRYAEVFQLVRLVI